MSERLQRTASSMREKMLNRYGDELHHKHNKNHHQHREHCKTHPTDPNHFSILEEGLYASTGRVREFNLRKFRKRLVKERIH